MQFNPNYTLKEDQPSRIFHDIFSPSVKLWINEKRPQQMTQDKLVSEANRAKAKACIHDNNSLDPRYLKLK